MFFLLRSEIRYLIEALQSISPYKYSQTYYPEFLALDLMQKREFPLLLHAGSFQLLGT